MLPPLLVRTKIFQNHHLNKQFSLLKLVVNCCLEENADLIMKAAQYYYMVIDGNKFNQKKACKLNSRLFTTV